MRVSMEEINTALAVMFGSDYIGDFMHNGQVRRVTVQADGKNRVDVEDVSRLHVRNAQGQMVPMSAFATLDWAMGPPQLNRYNGFPAFKINGSAAPGTAAARPCAPWNSWLRNCRAASASPGRASPTRKAVRQPGQRAVRAVHPGGVPGAGRAV